ncbi:MAG: 50S ribosomal protein L17 [Actinomycetota bacterium]
MPKPKQGPRLGSGPAHQKKILAGLCKSLFIQGQVQTTEAKAKMARPLAERMITFAKRGDLAARRRVLRVINDKEIVHTLFADIAPRFKERPGGYTRIVKTGFRKGDSAPMAIIELVDQGSSDE